MSSATADPSPFPRSPLQAITTPLFSLKAKLGFLGEPFRGRITKSGEKSESVADFVVRRMGREFLDYAINPFVRGVYAGDPKQLILNHAFPLMRELEHEGGSLLRGAMKRKRRQKKKVRHSRSVLSILSMDWIHFPRQFPESLAIGYGWALKLWLSIQLKTAGKLPGKRKAKTLRDFRRTYWFAYRLDPSRHSTGPVRSRIGLPKPPTSLTLLCIV